MLKGMDMEVKSHMSVLTPEMLEAVGKSVREHLQSRLARARERRA